MLNQLALVSTIGALSAEELAHTAAALQKQILRDFSPAWEVEAVIACFPSIHAVPLGYWPIIVVDDAPSLGVHYDHAGQPTANVAYGPTWSLAASHEALEMIADPYGDRLVTAEAPTGSGYVDYLIEVCDPCQDPANAYGIDGVLVSDFCTRAYYDSNGTSGGRYSFSGNIRTPREVLAGGYLTWRDSTTGHWMQARDRVDQVHDLGPIAPSMLTFRTAIDQLTGAKRARSNVPPEHPRVRTVRDDAEHHARARVIRAERWRTLLRDSRNTKE
jgi:hypothetical protein